MQASRIQALTRGTRRREEASKAPVSAGPRRSPRGTGPVHRAGPTRHDPALWEVEDAALYLMAPAHEFHARVRRMLRGAALIAASVVMTPALPVLFGLA